jgi:hypothetical protein
MSPYSFLFRTTMASRLLPDSFYADCVTSWHQCSLFVCPPSRSSVRHIYGSWWNYNTYIIEFDIATNLNHSALHQLMDTRPSYGCNHDPQISRENNRRSKPPRIIVGCTLDCSATTAPDSETRWIETNCIRLSNENNLKTYIKGAGNLSLDWNLSYLSWKNCNHTSKVCQVCQNFSIHGIDSWKLSVAKCTATILYRAFTRCKLWSQLEPIENIVI